MINRGCGMTQNTIQNTCNGLKCRFRDCSECIFYFDDKSHIPLFINGFLNVRKIVRVCTKDCINCCESCKEWF